MMPFFAREKRRLLFPFLLALTLLYAACGPRPAANTPSASDPMPASQSTVTPAGPAAAATASLTPSPSPQTTMQVWENFPAPRLTPVTPIPPPMTGLVIPDEVRVLAVAGVDRPAPYTGRTDAIALVIYHPRLARASLVSIPPDLFGYIPGYTMQRLYTAYPLGGARMFNSAIEYNLGIQPDQYAIFNLNSFTRLIDDLGGIKITVLENIVKYCANIHPGQMVMDGEQALCYMRLRFGEDEFARNARQQEVLKAVFLRLVEGGNLVRVPELYETYRSSIDSNLTLDGILEAVPLALKLGDPKRIGYFHLTPDQLQVWQISQNPDASVFLPNRPMLMRFLQEAVDYVNIPSPLSEVVVTLEYELTISPTPTSTSTATPTPTATISPTSTNTPTRAPTFTPSQTFTPTQSRTPTPLSTWTQAPTRVNTTVSP